MSRNPPLGSPLLSPSALPSEKPGEGRRGISSLNGGFAAKGGR